MKWFEMGYDRGQVADQIMAATAERVCEGYERTQWTGAQAGSLIMLHHYNQRNAYNDHTGQWERSEMPFYRAQLYYRSSGNLAVSSIVDFNDDYSYLVRAQELVTGEPKDLNDHVRIWDEAMAALDEALEYRASKIGIIICAPMVERRTEQSHLLAA